MILIKQVLNEFQVIELSRTRIITTCSDNNGAESHIDYTTPNVIFTGDEKQCIEFGFSRAEMQHQQLRKNVDTAIAAVDSVQTIFKTLFRGT